MPNQSPEKLDLRSMDITDEKKQQLKQLFPEVFREDKVDFDHLKRVLGEWVDPGKERFGLQWPGKAECMKTIQQPSIATLRPDREESVNFDETENLFIEGDNLEVLKLLQKSYFGKVKMIYIDPPYNTGNEFIYPDNYTESLDTYLKYTGQKDAEGNWQSTNKDTEGRFHSKWLNMMYPRLFLAKNLLRDDGLVFISIDDHEVAHLRKLCDEIYGEENFICEFIWRKAAGNQNDNNYVAISHEYILLYAKNKLNVSILNLPPTKEMLKTYNLTDEHVEERGKHYLRNLNDFSIGDRPGLHYDIECPDGTILKGNEHRWRCDRKKFEWRQENDRIVFDKINGEWNVFYKQYLYEKREQVIKDDNGNILSYGKIPESMLLNVASTGDGSSDIKSIFGTKEVFQYPKPIKLIQHFLTISTSKDDIVLDFFAGSNSTAHALLKQNLSDGSNRKFITVQLPEKIEDDSYAFKEGFKSITDISKERIRRVINQIDDEKSKKNQLELGDENVSKTELDLGFKVFKLTPSNFKVWEAPGVDIDPEELKAQLDAFSDHLNPENEEESILFELILKSGFPLTANIEKVELAGKNVFNVENGKLMICLADELTFEVLDAISEKEPQRVICLDNGFTGDDADALKTNAVQLFKSKEIEFRTV